MNRKRGFTLVEILVVIGIIVILVAISFPIYSAAKVRAHETACESNLYQIGRQEEGESNGDVTHCPYPQGDDDGEYIDVSDNYKSRDPNYAPDAGTVVTFCVEHLAKGKDTPFEVPLRGKFTVRRYGNGVGLIDAKGVTRWQKIGQEWKQIDETGDVPVYPQIWHFPGDDFPQK